MRHMNEIVHNMFGHLVIDSLVLDLLLPVVPVLLLSRGEVRLQLLDLLHLVRVVECRPLL